VRVALGTYKRACVLVCCVRESDNEPTDVRIEKGEDVYCLVTCTCTNTHTTTHDYVEENLRQIVFLETLIHENENEDR
jgi:hypothetical protein